jgi:hypothetical protein
LLLAVGLVAALWLATRRQAAVECTVCMEFGGRTACRTALGPRRDDAVRGAATTACSILSSGVTGGLACDRTPPRSVQCE